MEDENKIDENKIDETKVDDKEIKKDRKKEKSKEKKVWKKILKVVLIIIVVILILAIILATAAYLFIKAKLNKINYVELNVENLEIAEEMKDKLSDYRNIVFFGVDSRNLDYSVISEGGNNRADCIMLVSINIKTKDVKLMNFYRDTYLDLGKYGYENLNDAYSFGGVEAEVAALNRNFDLDIDEFVSLNFDSVKSLVDLLGGIDVDILPSEVHYLKICGITTPGVHHLNGEQATLYARIRKDSGETRRHERDRAVFIKCYEVAKTKNISELNKIVDEMLPRISTNIKPEEIFGMLSKFKDYKIQECENQPSRRRVVVDPENGRWHEYPCSLETVTQDIHTILFPDVEYKVSDRVKAISEKIIEVCGFDDDD